MTITIPEWLLWLLGVPLARVYCRHHESRRRLALDAGTLYWLLDEPR